MEQIDKDRRLIEEFIPIKEISEESAKEKNRRRGNINTFHVWWARKPLIPSRAAIFASLVKIHKFKLDYLNDVLIRICDWDSSVSRSKIKLAREIIAKSNEGKVPIVLDCFAGGGSIPLEALRLGCETYALELNPVASIIELCILTYLEKLNTSDNNFFVKKLQLTSDIKKWGEFVSSEVQNELKDVYPSKSKGETFYAYLWIHTVKCNNPSCNGTVPMFSTTWLRMNANKTGIAYDVISKDGQLKFVIKNMNKDSDFKFNQPVKRGSVKCPHCNQALDASYIKKCGKNGELHHTLIAKVLLDNKNHRHFYIVDTADEKLYNKTKSMLSKYEKDIPKEKMRYNGRYLTPTLYGYDEWSKLFNFRQLLSIVVFSKKIREAYHKMIEEGYDNEYAKIIITYLAIAHDILINKNSILCVWNSSETALNVSKTFNRQALQMTWNYAEGDPFYFWKQGIERIIQFVERESIISKPIGKVFNGTATSLPFEDKIFDAIIIDPPYYDAVPYADLSDFFYVWLKKTIGDLYPDLFKNPLTPKSSEILQDPERHGGEEKSKIWYESQLTKSFNEINRTLKDDGIFVIIFAHTSTIAWETIVESILNSEFTVNASWPLHTERPGRFRAQKSAALASSIFIVCRKRLTEEEGYFDDIKEKLENKIHGKLDEFWEYGIRGADFFISAIGPAVEIFGRYKKIRKLSGEKVNVTEFLDIVRQIVTDYSLRKILREGSLGEIDEITRFYVLWRWAYNNGEIIFDDARKLAQALGTEADQLIHKEDILEKKGDKVKLLGPKERAKNKDLGKPKGGISSPMIDVIHRACLLWEKGNKKELAEFVDESGYKDNETIWNIAQALSEILPEGEKEKQLLQGLLASKSTAISDRFKTQRTLTSFRGKSNV